MSHLKKYWALHATWILAGVAVLGQATHDYLSTHPKVTAAGFFGAMAWAAYNFFAKSPTQS